MKTSSIATPAGLTASNIEPRHAGRICRYAYLLGLACRWRLTKFVPWLPARRIPSGAYAAAVFWFFGRRLRSIRIAVMLGIGLSSWLNILLLVPFVCVALHTRRRGERQFLGVFGCGSELPKQAMTEGFR